MTTTTISEQYEIAEYRTMMSIESFAEIMRLEV
jgi:hypothetical protein